MSLDAITKSKFNIFKSTYEVELLALYGENSKVVDIKLKEIGGRLEDLGYGFGIISILPEKINFLRNINEIIYVELPKVLNLSYDKANGAACINDAVNKFGLSGEGVLIGFIDSGIDYTHPAFLDELGNTRIKYIYDFHLGGVSYSSEDIDRALKNKNYFSVVHEDSIGHGTAVASIACGGGNIQKEYFGVAFKSGIIMVKITEAKSTEIMRAIKIILDKAKELKKPLVINLSYSTNEGAHKGHSLLEQYISIIAGLLRLSFVIAAGNEAAASHHVGGDLKKQQSIEISIALDEANLIMYIYKDILDDISIEIKNPSGISTGFLNVKSTVLQGDIGSDRYILYFSGPKPIDINGEIIFALYSKDRYLSSGTWTINIRLEQGKGSKYDMWLPIAEGLNVNTKFLAPELNNTLGIPATAENIISVGSYNFVTDEISSFSGRGNNNYKPDLVAPGENIIAAKPKGGFDSFTGTSMAAPMVAGSAALLMQWGILKNNDEYLYGERLRYFLIKGCRRNKSFINYPDNMWGYGSLCLNNSMDLLIFNRQKENMKRQDNCGDLYVLEDYENYIVEYDGDIITKFKEINNGCAFLIDDKYAVISVKKDIKDNIINNVKEIVYVQDRIFYTLNQISSLESSNINKFHEHPNLNLTGRGVIIGLIDTGIDYLNKEFMYENNKTRILRLWDQSLNEGIKPQGFIFGTEYKEEDINKAIELSNLGKDSYTLVKTKDYIGHGTAMASIIAGRGINADLKGAAFESEIIAVKLRTINQDIVKANGFSSSNIPIYENTDVILAIKYLFEEARKLNKPIVIHVPLGSNSGSHNGELIIEQYIDDLSHNRGVVFVTGTGNEGDEDIHCTGKIEKTGDKSTIELNVDKEEKNIEFNIWVMKPDKISIGIVSPSGEYIEKIPAKFKEKEEIKLVFEGSSITVTYFFPEEKSGDERIRISIKNITAGIWQFRLEGDYILKGEYHAWLPQSNLIKPNTRFLNSSPFNTLTAPSSSKMIITSGFYNQNTNSIVSASGRGYTFTGAVKPDITAGGVNQIAAMPGGGVTSVTGSSVASAVTAGAVALMLQWGIVDGNDTTIYSTKIKTYLIRGAKRRIGEVYPNTQWGYGILDLQGVFENIRKVYVRIPEILRL